MMTEGAGSATPSRLQEDSLIPRSALFGNPVRTQARLSPDGRYISFLAPKDGVLNVWLAPFGKLEAAKPITDDRKRGIRGKGAPGGRFKPCPFCREKIDIVDYKDLSALRRAISDKGKIRSSRVTGACRRHQSQLATAVKRAREVGLLPYVADR